MSEKINSSLLPVPTKIKGVKNWETQEFTVHEHTFKLSNVHESMKKNCEFHGYMSKLIDAPSQMTKAKGYTDKERLAKMIEVDKRLCSKTDPKWNSGTAAGDGIKKSELKAQVVEKEAELAKINIKLDEANALIEKLMATTDKKK